MTWLQNNQYLFTFSTYPKFCNITDGWIIKVNKDKTEFLDIPVLEKIIDFKDKKPGKILIKEKINSKQLKIIHTNNLNAGQIIKFDLNISKKLDFLLYFEIIDIDKENKIITLDKNIPFKLSKLTFLEVSNYTGIYYFPFTPKEIGMYYFEISNPKYGIKEFGRSVEVKEQFFIKTLIDEYTKELNKKFIFKDYNPQISNSITDSEDAVWFNKSTGEIWIKKENKEDKWIKN